MGSASIQEGVADSAPEAESTIAGVQNPQKLNKSPTDHHSDENLGMWDKLRKQHWTQGDSKQERPGNIKAAGFKMQKISCEEKLEILKRRRPLQNNKKSQHTETSETVQSATANKQLHVQQQNNKKAVNDLRPTGDDVEGQAVYASCTTDMKTSLPALRPLSIPLCSVDIVHQDEVPIELCPFSSDGSAEESQPEHPPRITDNLQNALNELTTAAFAAATSDLSTPRNITPTLTSVTAREPTTNTTSRTMGKRKRRKKLSYSAPRNKLAAKMKQEMPLAFASPTHKTEHSIAANRAEAEKGFNAPASPVYPNADASHLYTSTSEGGSWRWKDVDPYFSPLIQDDLDNLVRWRKENASNIAASSNLWSNVPNVVKKRAILEAMLADSLETGVANIAVCIRRGRHYRDVWEETDLLAQIKRDCLVEESHLEKKCMKRRCTELFSSTSQILESHRNLVYGYDDDLYQELIGRLENRVKMYQQGVNAKYVDNDLEVSAAQLAFDEEVLPSIPICQLHPASLGIWKLSNNEKSDLSIVHPASMNRAQVPNRCKEEIKQHHQRHLGLQREQLDHLAVPSDKYGEDVGGAMYDRHNFTIMNSEMTDRLPSFGGVLEVDEISKELDASVRKLVSLSMYNWQIAQLVFERAMCSIQCAPIIENEAAVARELEEAYLQLCPPVSSNNDISLYPLNIGPARQPRTFQVMRAPQDMTANSVRHEIADNSSLAVAASVEFALSLKQGDVVDVLDRSGCWNYGEVVDIFPKDRLGIAKLILLRFSLWFEDTVEWIAASEGRILPQGVAAGLRSCSVGPTRAHRVRVQHDHSLAKDLERLFSKRQCNQAASTSQFLAHWKHNIVARSSTIQHNAPQKRKRKRPSKSGAVVVSTC